jgi:hypothetical protein
MTKQASNSSTDHGGGKRCMVMLGRLIKWAVDRAPGEGDRREGRLGSRIMRLGLYLATMLAASSLAEAETPLTIDQLLAQGWEIAGYASGYDNRTSLILFRHTM